MATAFTKASLTATGSVALAGLPDEGNSLVQISGTYGTVTFVCEGLLPDSDVWCPLAVRNQGSLAVTPGGTALAPSDNATVLYAVNSRGCERVRARVTAIASGTATFHISAIESQAESFQVAAASSASATALGTLTVSGTSTLSGDLLVDNGAGVLVGATTQETISNGDGATNLVPELQIQGTAQADASALLACFNTTDTVAATLAFAKSGNAAIGSHTTVADNEYLGRIIAFADDSADIETPCAEIRFVVDGTPAADQVGGSIELFTTPDGSTTLTKRWTVAEDGNLVAATALDIEIPANTAAALEFSDATTKVIALDTRNTVKDVDSVTVTGVPVTVATEVAEHRNASVNIADKTVTYTGTATVTSSHGAQLYVGAPTFTDAAAGTITSASSVHIEALAAAGDALTITNSRMITTGVSDCFLTNAGVWTDTSCWAWGKENIAQATTGAIKTVLGKLNPKSWKYNPGVVGNDFDRERVGIVYDDLPEELRCPGDERGVATGVLASFALAALKCLKDENDELRSRLDRLEAAVI